MNARENSRNSRICSRVSVTNGSPSLSLNSAHELCGNRARARPRPRSALPLAALPSPRPRLQGQSPSNNTAQRNALGIPPTQNRFALKAPAKPQPLLILCNAHTKNENHPAPRCRDRIDHCMLKWLKRLFAGLIPCQQWGGVELSASDRMRTPTLTFVSASLFAQNEFSAKLQLLEQPALAIGPQAQD